MFQKSLTFYFKILFMLHNVVGNIIKWLGFFVHSVNVYNLEKQVGGYEWCADLGEEIGRLLMLSSRYSTPEQQLMIW